MLVEVKVWDEKPAKRHSWHGGAAQQRSDVITHLQQSSLHSYGPQGDKMQCLAIPCLSLHHSVQKQVHCQNAMSRVHVHYVSRVTHIATYERTIQI